MLYTLLIEEIPAHDRRGRETYTAGRRACALVGAAPHPRSIVGVAVAARRRGARQLRLIPFDRPAIPTRARAGFDIWRFAKSCLADPTERS
jgi:hypothetical protein